MLGVPLLGITGLCCSGAAVAASPMATPDRAGRGRLRDSGGSEATAPGPSPDPAARSIDSAGAPQRAAEPGTQSAFLAARQLLVLTSTYAMAARRNRPKGFLEQLDDPRLADDARFAVLGFGDRRFPRFCQYAKDVEAACWRMVRAADGARRT
jgi:sulfite reductase (NADPH) flavoprotein alpha-component